MLQILNEISLNSPLVNNSNLGDYRLSNEKKEKLQQKLGSLGYRFNFYTSYAITDKEKLNKPANYAIIPNQYFSFSSDIYDFATELYKYFELYERVKPYARSLVGNSEYISNTIKLTSSIRAQFTNDSDIDLFAKFLDKDNDIYRFGSKRLIDDNGKPRSANDCFGSVILKAINLPDASSSIFGKLVYDLCANPDVYKEISQIYGKTKTADDHFRLSFSKPFLLLAGISGTGKTRFVREQAKSTGALNDTYCLTSVRPDWHEPSDLLGYISRLNGPAEYVTTDVLQFIARAWRAIAASELIIDEQNISGNDTGLAVSGDRNALENVKPYWLCLDEMNLAPVEQYFADYLAVLETREWHWSGDNFIYRCDALLKPATINELNDESRLTLRHTLGFDNAEYDALWQLIAQYGLTIPFNLIVAGTVNMDETTHGFSRKVIDRALSFDFGAFFPNDYEAFFTPNSRQKSLSYPILSHTTQADLSATCDADGKKTITFLNAVNSVLKNTPFELAYRALNELLLAVVCVNPQDEPTLHAVWDDFLMCKVLPRIEGDSDKVGSEPSILQRLETTLVAQLSLTWDEENDADTARPDLYREKITTEDATEDEKIIRIACRSKIKLHWMQERLDKSGFTSFWP